MPRYNYKDGAGKMLRIMKRAAAFLLTAVMIVSAASCGEEPITGNLGEVKREENANEVYAEITVRDFGKITAKLFPGAAPNAVERFTENAELGYYDGTTIHRIIPNYVIQGGSLNGDGSDGNVPDSLYLPVETTNVTFNFYGALCLAASKKGCYSQFYIVNNHEPQDIDAVIDKLTEQLSDETFASRLLEEDKKKYQDYLDKLKAIPKEVKEKYKRVGGLYDLDGTSTVMGQVIDGYDVLKAISAVEVVAGNKSDDKAGMPSKPLDPVIIERVQIIRIESAVTEETTEETKKTAKAKKNTGDEVNAETLPTAESTEDTTAPAEGAEGASSEDTTTEAGDGSVGNGAEAPAEAVTVISELTDETENTVLISEISDSEEEIIVIEE
ncbi:MAG: peptidylprolyl isomerase [Ruminiclostridium sp.]|nr:peptidylprolyl isomerase [Ruminiclostridium sp.]